LSWEDISEIEGFLAGEADGRWDSEVEDGGQSTMIYDLQCRQIAGEVDGPRAKGERSRRP
jgi:hypothetical protein